MKGSIILLVLFGLVVSCSAHAGAIDYAREFQWNSTLGILLFWVPLAFCLFGYTLRTAKNYRKDLARRESETFYHPTDTIGALMGRALVSIIPVANIWAAMFDLAPEVFGRLFKWLGQVFDQPLVPDNERARAMRDARKIERESRGLK